MSETTILSKGVPFVVDELTEEEEMKFYAECGKRMLQMVKEYWLSTGLFYENEEGKLCLKERSGDDDLPKKERQIGDEPRRVHRVGGIA